MRAQSMGFGELNVEYGYCYRSAAIVPDGSVPFSLSGVPLPATGGDDCTRPLGGVW